MINMLNNYCRCYGGGQSLRAWRRNRDTMALEPKVISKRKNETPLVSSTAQKKPKSYVGTMEDVSWNENELIKEIEGYNNDEKMNWSALARKYIVKNKNNDIAKNSGQVIKEWLRSKGVDVDRFKRKQAEVEDTANVCIRRKKRRIAGGEETLPTKVTIEQLKAIAKENISRGEYIVGERIVPMKVSVI